MAFLKFFSAKLFFYKSHSLENFEYDMMDWKLKLFSFVFIWEKHNSFTNHFLIEK
jgi:hypothetical protein